MWWIVVELVMLTAVIWKSISSARECVCECVAAHKMSGKEFGIPIVLQLGESTKTHENIKPNALLLDSVLLLFYSSAKVYTFWLYCIANRIILVHFGWNAINYIPLVLVKCVRVSVVSHQKIPIQFSFCSLSLPVCSSNFVFLFLSLLHFHFFLFWLLFHLSLSSVNYVQSCENSYETSPKHILHRPDPSFSFK